MLPEKNEFFSSKYKLFREQYFHPDNDRLNSIIHVDATGWFDGIRQTIFFDPAHFSDSGNEPNISVASAQEQGAQPPKTHHGVSGGRATVKKETKYCRDSLGLLQSVDYKFNEDGSVNWRAMVDSKHLFPNKSWFEARDKPAPRSVLINHSDFEINNPSKESVIGFIATWISVGILIKVFLWIIS